MVVVRVGWSEESRFGRRVECLSHCALADSLDRAFLIPHCTVRAFERSECLLPVSHTIAPPTGALEPMLRSDYAPWLLQQWAAAVLHLRNCESMSKVHNSFVVRLAPVQVQVLRPTLRGMHN